MSNMSCSEFNRLLSQAVESRTSVDSPDLRAHAALCESCRPGWLDALLVDRAIAEWTSAQRSGGPRPRLCPCPPVDMADAILFRMAVQEMIPAQEPPAVPNRSSGFSPPPTRVELATSTASSASEPIATEQRSSARGRRFLRASALVTATAVATALAAAFFSGRFPGGGTAVKHQPIIATDSVAKPVPAVTVPPKAAVAHAQPAAGRSGAPMGTQVAARTGSSTATAAAPAPAPIATSRQDVARDSTTAVADAHVETMVRHAGRAGLSLANEAASAVTAAALFVPPADGARAASPANETDDPWVDDVRREFEPVGKNLKQAFEFLFEALPTEKAPAT